MTLSHLICFDRLWLARPSAPQLPICSRHLSFFGSHMRSHMCCASFFPPAFAQSGHCHQHICRSHNPLFAGEQITTDFRPWLLVFFGATSGDVLWCVVPGFQPLLRHQQATQESLGTAGTVADSTLTSFNSLRRWEHPMQETDASLGAKSRRA